MALLVNKSILPAAVLGLTLLITGGWCLYFDQKAKKGDKVRTPALQKKAFRKRPSKDALQNFFLQEIESGERSLVAGDLETSAEHFVNAIVVCENPGKLLEIYRQTLPKDFYRALKQEIRSICVN